MLLLHVEGCVFMFCCLYYHRVFAPKCASCNQPILPAQVNSISNYMLWKLIIKSPTLPSKSDTCWCLFDREIQYQRSADVTDTSVYLRITVVKNPFHLNKWQRFIYKHTPPRRHNRPLKLKLKNSSSSLQVSLNVVQWLFNVILQKKKASSQQP